MFVHMYICTVYMHTYRNAWDVHYMNERVHILYVDIQHKHGQEHGHGNGHADGYGTWTWSCNMETDQQHGHGHENAA